ncbi:LOW QUALITY PROTEIN: transient receptor potential cation channel subfamily A member 1-like [Xenia sp. Carnegie-2017]|uniref:LOW QUALITY PROTEIN: transient receptor potential cation channel subfamily A member 1-like n=1 Tax=Xenia sp. Carnegie-2017 TaxID=2897299 RepID=UPI001F03FF1D|nr:LOW QUALITY PROTEIN: transient receptor potential cation channel subfamily A member 1-like [Xenia sp. Carnegie-2017]
MFTPGEKRKAYLRYNKSEDCSFTNAGFDSPSTPLTSIDPEDTEDEEQNGNNNTNPEADQLKLAAIYDDEVKIKDILSACTGEEIQRLLSEPDETGQPCIFYALESRTRNSLTCLLNHVKGTKSVVAENGETVLHVATRMGNVDILRHLLQYEFIVDLVNHVESINGRSPLHFAAMFNHVEIAKVLLEHGGNITKVDITESSPLYIAAYRGHAEMLDLFLENDKSGVKELLFGEKYGGSHYRNILHVALDSGNERTVQVCLQQDGGIILPCLRDEINSNSYLIHAACNNGMDKVLSLFVDMMEDLVVQQMMIKDKEGFTPLQLAAINNHSGVVRYIGSLSKGFLNEITKTSLSALVLAVDKGHIEVVEELLKLKADFTIRDDSNKTVLHNATAHPEILRILLKKNDLMLSLINEKRADDGYTPIHDAAYKGLIESVKILLEHGADLNVFSKAYQSPLHCAVISQKPDVVQLILCHEPGLINKVNDKKQAPIHTAAKHCNPDVVNCLLNSGATVLGDSKISTPLHIAAQYGHLNIIKLLLEHKSSIIDLKNTDQRTALLEAACNGKADVVKYLLDNKAAITKDREFFNCLDWTIIKGDEDSAMVMMCHERWKEIMNETRNGPEGTMAKLVSKNMSEVAYQALCNSRKSTGHPESVDYKVEYDFMCLQNDALETRKAAKKLKPMTAIKAMLRHNSYKCLRHPVCCKYLKTKWMEFGWNVFSRINSFLFFLFLLTCMLLVFLHTKRRLFQIIQRSLKIPHASINVKVATVFCLLSASIQILIEIGQILLRRTNYFLDDVNVLEWVLYVTTFIFAVPSNDNISVKTSFQWKACSIALFCVWINLVMYLRRFASYGIIILMMKKIFFTLIKVLGLLIFFIVAFGAAFTVIMNDREEFRRFSVSILTTATMTMGEFNFKERFLGDRNEYNTFYPLQMTLLIIFIVLMAIIIINLMLALSIDDTSSIMQRAKLQKHIQTAKMIIDMERKRYTFFTRRRISFVDPLDEWPNRKDSFSRKLWGIIFYGPDFSTDQVDENSEQMGKEDDTLALIEMVKELQMQNAIFQKKVMASLEENGKPSKSIDASQVCNESERSSRDTIVQFRRRLLKKKQENETTLNKSRLEELKRQHSRMNSEDVDDCVGDHTIWKYES